MVHVDVFPYSRNKRRHLVGLCDWHTSCVSEVRKVQCTLVQALRLYTGRTAHRGSRGIALLFLDHCTRSWWVVSSTPRPLFTPGKDPVPIVQEAGWAPGPVWTGAENLAPTGIWSLDRPAHSSVAILTELPGPQLHARYRGKSIIRDTERGIRDICPVLFAKISASQCILLVQKLTKLSSECFHCH